MPELVVPISEQPEQVDRLVDGILDLHYDPSETTLSVINVFEEFEVNSATWTSVESVDFYDADELPDTVATAAARLSEAGFTVDVRREHGNPAKCILDLADGIAADAIVMASRQRSPVGKVILGSGAQGVLLDANRPVIVVPTTDDRP